ncbi:MAG TPA: rRNA maturation RNase YbeY [Bauldia sp.]|nr:rRNA maturation RNase YbeY [Bauldia sp.]
MTGRRRTRPARPAPVAVEIVVEAGDWTGLTRLRPRLRKAVLAAASASGRAIAAGGETAIVLSSNRRVRALNRRYRGKDRPTNVLSFPASPPGKEYGPLLGDIVLAQETVAAEASEQEIPLSHHIIHLVIHGFLHLLGYDHEIESEAVAMERLETTILRGLGVPDPYAGQGNRGSGAPEKR